MPLCKLAPDCHGQEEGKQHGLLACLHHQVMLHNSCKLPVWQLSHLEKWMYGIKVPRKILYMKLREMWIGAAI